MKVTEAGRNLILAIGKKLNKPVCHIEVAERDDGGRGLQIALITWAETNRVIHVDGVDFDISIEDEFQIEGYTFDAVGAHLRAIPPERNCH